MSDSGFAAAEPSNLPKNAVHQLAEQVARMLEFEPGGDLSKVLQRMGGRLAYRQFSGLGESDSGSLHVYGDGNFEINLSTNTSLARDRFTIAHEIGHYVLHYLWRRQNGQTVPDKMVAARYGSDRSEWEANWFAAAFLMPAGSFSEYHREVQGNLHKISEKFGVSLKAAEVRAEALGLSKV